MSMLALIASPGKIRALKIGLVRCLNILILLLDVNSTISGGVTDDAIRDRLGHHSVLVGRRRSLPSLLVFQNFRVVFVK